MTGFKLRGEIADIQVIAAGTGVRVRAKLNKVYGTGYWRKLKGRAWSNFRTVALPGPSYTGTRLTGSGVGT